MNSAAMLVLTSGAQASRLTEIDWIVIAIYFSILIAVAWWVVRTGKDSAADYFLAGRNLGWWIIGASIFASNIGSEHVVGLAGAGATSGGGARALRIACLVPAGAGLGVRAVLHAVDGIHHAGISGAAIQPGVSLRALGSFDHHFYCVKDCRRNFCRRRGVWHAPA